MVTVPIPVASGVMFFILDYDTETLVELSTLELSGFSNNVIPVYMVSDTDRTSISIRTTSSSNIDAKILDGSKDISDFMDIERNNLCSVSNVSKDTIYRLTLSISILNFDINNGEFDILWT